MFGFKKKNTFKKNFRQGAEQAAGAVAVGLVGELFLVGIRALGRAAAEASKDEEKKGNASANENEEKPAVEGKGAKPKANAA